MCESEKVCADVHASIFPEGARTRAFAQVIHSNKFDNNPSAALGVWYAALERVLIQAKDANISSEIPRFAQGVYKRAVSTGHGNEDVASLISVLCDRRP